ncbi:MAG: Panacea domain-containing protein [Tepidisphaeraceae bacterium]
MVIRFQFQPEKAMQAIAYLLHRLGAVEKVKLTKLLYYADREHFIRFGFPITGDRQKALPLGPVPSTCLDLLNGDPLLPSDRVFDYIHLDDYRVSLRKSPGEQLLSDDDRRTLDDVIRRHGGKEQWTLVRESHSLPEYREIYVEGTARPIPYEVIAKHSGNDARFRKGRPVISTAATAQMSCPLPVGSGADL